MNRVLISVEGQTEETFVREILTNYLWNYNVDPTPVVIATKFVKRGNKFKGGLSSYAQVKNDIQKLLRDTNAVAVTTMYDLYKLPTDFPGCANKPAGTGHAKAAYLENAFQQDIAHRRFRPYFQIHEFEAILFVNPDITARMFPENNQLQALVQIRNDFPGPEDINDGMHTAPSKRILDLYPNYEKPLYGSLIAIDLGLNAIRAQCPHLNDWITWLEGLGQL